MTALIVLTAVVYVVLCALLILLVLIQPGKSGGGLGGMGGGSVSSAFSDSLGATDAEKRLARWTTFAAGGFFVLALGLTLLSNMREHASGQLKLKSSTPTAPAVVGDATNRPPADVVPLEAPEGGAPKPSTP